MNRMLMLLLLLAGCSRPPDFPVLSPVPDFTLIEQHLVTECRMVIFGDLQAYGCIPRGLGDSNRSGTASGSAAPLILNEFGVFKATIV